MGIIEISGRQRRPGALLIAALGFALSTPVIAQSNPGASVVSESVADPRTNRMLVLDASGSMWNAMSDTNSPLRAQLAAKFVEKFTAQLAGESPQRRLGMVRLGYQYSWTDRPPPSEQKLCSDVEVVVKPANASQVRNTIAYESGVGRKMAEKDGKDPRDYNPKGYTPLKLAIEQAAYAAPPEGATLVVVTDLDEKDKHCRPDPCGDDGKPLPVLERLLRERHIEIRYVIAAGLIGSIGERAKRFARCFGAEYKLLDSLDRAEKVGIEVGLNLIREAPRPSVAVQMAPPRGTITLALQDASGERIESPAGSQLEVRRPNVTAPLLRLPGRETTDPGRYESSFSVGKRQWRLTDVEVSPNDQTEIAYIFAGGVLRMSLMDTDFRTLDNETETVWEVSSASGQTAQPILRVKGTRMNQTLPAGKYHVNIYTSTEVISKEVDVEPGREMEVKIQLRQQ